MTAEQRSNSEIKLDKTLLLKILGSPGLAKKIKKGLYILKKEDQESAFSAGMQTPDDVVLSSQTRGKTEIYAKSVDDFFLNGGLVARSVNLKDIKFPNLGTITRIADFHFHPDGDTTPSYQDAEAVVKCLYRNSDTRIQVHKMFFGGIFARKKERGPSKILGFADRQLSCLFYGLGKAGLTSNDYQAWDALNKASGYKEAMKKSGFWISEGSVSIQRNVDLVWDQKFIDEVAKNLEN